MATIELDPEIQAEQLLAEDLANYAGQWVAIRQHAVVASAPTLKELREQIGQEEVEVAFQVPEGDTSACFF